MAAPSVVRDRTPNFPTPPVNSNMSPLSMPLDLEANGRNFYTEFFFLDYRTAALSPVLAGNLNDFFSSGTNNTAETISTISGAVLGAGLGSLAGGAIGGLVGTAIGAIAGTSLTTSGGAQRTSSVRLPIPRTINDIVTLNWQQQSGLQLASQLNPGIAAAVNLGSLGLAFVGKAINPMLFLAFNHQNFREFTFEWVLAPRNQQESNTIKRIVDLFKNSSLPTRGIIMDYPLIAMVRMSPNDLNGHMKFKPMAIQAVSANYTPNPTGPSFFGEANRSNGAPTMVTLTVKLLEIKLWYRGEVK